MITRLSAPPLSARRLALAALAALPVLLSPDPVSGQLDRLRRARERLTSAPSLESLFGAEPPITSSLADAKDGVPALDGFEPASFSPMGEMPRGPGGYILLAPGAYTFEAQSFCIRAGTWGPSRKGGGYLHAELKGPKAQIVSAIIGRSSDHPDIAQRDVQLVLWAVIARARPSTWRRDLKVTAARLLTPDEIADLEGYSLNAVPDALRKRVLENVPEPARRVFEAENELRGLMSSSDARFEDLERVAVLAGEPPDDASDSLPPDRWSFHPNGFFIRYRPGHYTHTRIQVYYPVSVEIERDAKGNITSVTTPDGRWVGAEYEDAPAPSFAANGGRAPDRRLRAIRFSAPPGAGAARPSEWRAGPAARIPAPRWSDPRRGATALGPFDLLDRARADLQDLALLEGVMEEELAPLAEADADAAAASALMRGAVHTALARYYGLLGRGPDDTPARPAPAPGAIGTASGSRYVIAAGVDGGTRFQHPGRMMPIQPGNGGAFPSGPLLQRLAQSPRPADGDALDKAKRIVGAMSNFNDGLGLATDPAGFFGGLLPGQMFGAGMDWNFDNARKISDAMQGATGGHDDAMLDPRSPAAPQDPWNVAAPRSVRTASSSLDPGPDAPTWLRVTGRQEYRSVWRPRQVELPLTPTSARVSPEHAGAVDAVLQATFRTGALLEAARIAQERHRAAAEAHDAQWEYAQAEALVYLKREAGLGMTALAEDLETLRSALGPGEAALGTEESVREAKARLAAEGMPAEAVEVARAVGLPDDWARQRQARLSRLSATAVAEEGDRALLALIDELRSYGTWWASLPVVPTPWVDEGAPGGR